MPTIIAELCQNHNGDFSILEDMVYAAAEAGADYAKIQSMLADDLTRRERFEHGLERDGKQVAIKRPYQAEYDRLKPMDLDDEAHHRFLDVCERAGIKALTSVFSRSRVPFLATLGFDAIKVPSYDCASLPLLRELMPHFGHLFISTGATFNEEIQAASSVLGDHSYSLLHCVTIYPTPLHEMHLARLEFLRQFAPSVGFSDHSLVFRDGIKASAVALLLGADVIERHFTILEPDETKDGPVSINPAQLAELVQVARMDPGDRKQYVAEHVGTFDEMIGEADRQLSDQELLNRDYYRGRFASRTPDGFVFNWEEQPFR
jgi:sialic acid synthase SpsE